MIQAKFIKWYPFNDSKLTDIEWDEIYEYETDEDWLEAVNNITKLGFFVAIHRESTGMIAIAIDTTWFSRR